MGTSRFVVNTKRAAHGRRLRQTARNLGAHAGRSLMHRADEATRIGCWRLTRRLPGNGRLLLFRAAVADDGGPGCYVLKKPSGSSSDATIDRALLRREATVAAEAAHRNLVPMLASDWSGRQPHVVLPYVEGITLRRLLDCLLNSGDFRAPARQLSLF